MVTEEQREISRAVGEEVEAMTPGMKTAGWGGNPIDILRSRGIPETPENIQRVYSEFKRHHVSMYQPPPRVLAKPREVPKVEPKPSEPIVKEIVTPIPGKPYSRLEKVTEVAPYTYATEAGVHYTLQDGLLVPTIRTGGGFASLAKPQTVQQVGQQVISQALHSVVYGGPDIMIVPPEQKITKIPEWMIVPKTQRLVEQQIEERKKTESLRLKIEFGERLAKAPPAERVFWGLGTMTTPSFVPLTVSTVGALTGIDTGYPLPEEIVAEEFVRQKMLIGREAPLITHGRRQWETWVEGVGFPITMYVGGQVAGWTAKWAFPKIATAISKIPVVSTVATKVGGAIVAHPKAIAIGAGVLTVGFEAEKVRTMHIEGVPPAGIAGYVAKDIASMYLGSKGFVKGFQEGAPWRYWGKEKIPPEMIIEPQIIEGKEMFPTTHKGARALVREFKVGEYAIKPGEIGGWHTTGELGAFTKQGIEITVGKTPGAVGLHISPSLSPHFLRISPDKTLFGYTRTVLFADPKALWFDVEDITRIPPDIRGKGMESMLNWLTKDAQKTKGYISPAFELGKTEKEALIAPGAFAQRITGDFTKYTVWSGTKVPIYEYGVTGGRIGESASKVASDFLKSMSRYYTYKEPFIKVESILASLAVTTITRPSYRDTPKSIISVPPISSRVSIISDVSVPSYPSYPSRVSIPSYPSIPSKPSLPSYPSVPSRPSIPSYPSIPSRVSLVSLPSYPSTPSRPSYPSIPKYPEVPSPTHYPFPFLLPGLPKFKKRLDFWIPTIQPKGYRPTVGAIIMGFKGRIPKGYGRKGMLLGFEERPIPYRRRRRKKRRVKQVARRKRRKTKRKRKRRRR